MKIPKVTPQQAAIGLVSIIVLIIVLSPDRLRDQILESIRKTGWLAVLLFGLSRLALGFTGWPLLAATSLALIPSGALGDLAEGAGEIVKGFGRPNTGGAPAKDPDALCAAHGGVQLIAGSTVVCRDGTIK